MARTTLLVADPLALVSETLCIALSRYADFRVLEDRPQNGPSTVEAVMRLKPDVALIDFWMPDMSGEVITSTIVSKAPRCRVILISWLWATPQIHKALEAGAAEFLTKDFSVAEVADAIRRVSQGEATQHAQPFQDAITKRLTHLDENLARFRSLSPRQIEILVLLKGGRSTREIANRLVLSPNTVRNHIAQIMEKTGTFSQTELLAKAQECGFLQN